MKFTVLTDHEPNTSLRTQSVLSRRLARWSEFLESFAFEWQYRAGRGNPADPLSRFPGHLDVRAATVMTIRATQALGHLVTLPGVTSEYLNSLPSFEQHVLEGYATDPWFAVPENVANSRFSRRDGFWFRQQEVHGLKVNALVLPNAHNLYHRVLSLCHDHPMSGHLGTTKTLDFVLRRFWWPGVRNFVREYCSTCDSCQRVKPEHTFPAGKLLPHAIPSLKWREVTMDFVTDLPPDSKDNNAIFVVVDRLTKMVHFTPCRTTINAVEAAQLFYDNVVRLHGIPAKIICDRDPKFRSAFFLSFLALSGVEVALSTSYHPQTDGQTERKNRDLEDMLRHYVSGDLTNWSQFLSMVEFAVNNSFHESIKTTPFLLNYGFEPLTPASHLIRQLGDRKARDRRNTFDEHYQTLHNEVALSMHHDMQVALERAKECLRVARERMVRFANEKRTERTFKPGDRVLLSSKHMRLTGPRKLLPRYIGPFTVTDVINPVAYRLDLPNNVRIHNVFHVSLLKLYLDGGRVPLPPPPEVVDGELEFEVEKILDHKVVASKDKKRGRKRFFLLRWKGQGPEYDSWEPESNLTNCADLLRVYWATATPTAPTSQTPMESVPASTDGMRKTRSGRAVKPPPVRSFLLLSSRSNPVSEVFTALLLHGVPSWRRS